jgi:hypothetical protein
MTAPPPNRPSINRSSFPLGFGKWLIELQESAIHDRFRRIKNADFSKGFNGLVAVSGARLSLTLH